MFAENLKCIREFDWKDLDGKIVKIAVAPPDPSVLEPIGQVFAVDSDMKIYILHEWYASETSKRKGLI